MDYIQIELPHTTAAFHSHQIFLDSLAFHSDSHYAVGLKIRVIRICNVVSLLVSSHHF